MSPSETEIVVQVFSQQILLQAQMAAHLRVIEALARQAGLEHLTGGKLSGVISGLCDHFQKELLLALENKNPAMAAAVSAILEKTRTDGTGLF